VGAFGADGKIWAVVAISRGLGSRNDRSEFNQANSRLCATPWAPGHEQITAAVFQPRVWEAFGPLPGGLLEFLGIVNRRGLRAAEVDVQVGPEAEGLVLGRRRCSHSPGPMLAPSSTPMGAV
jgi:hypothetical protein